MCPAGRHMSSVPKNPFVPNAAKASVVRVPPGQAKPVRFGGFVAGGMRRVSVEPERDMWTRVEGDLRWRGVERSQDNALTPLTRSTPSVSGKFLPHGSGRSNRSRT